MIAGLLIMLKNCHQIQMGLSGFLLIPALVIFISIGVSGIVFGIYLKYKLQASMLWPITEGIVVSSDYTRTNDSRGGSQSQSTLYSPEVKFKFNVNNREYVSDKITWGGEVRSNQKNLVGERLKQYPIGKVIDVHYNPKKPADCIVDPDYSFEMKLPLIGGSFFIVMGSIFLTIVIKGFISQLSEKGLWPY